MVKRENYEVPWRWEYLDFRQAMDFLKCSEVTLRRLTRDKKIPYGKVGGTLRFRLQDLRDYIEKSA